MSEVRRVGSGREGPKETRIRAVVDAVVRDDSVKEAYVCFARELMLAERRPARRDSSEYRSQKPEFRVRAGGHPQIAQMTPIDGFRRGCRRPFPDYSKRTKMVGMKHFRRGLHGNLMWRIGEQLIPRPGTR